ncbi:MAG: hypothetical protein ACOCUT_00220 [bacterium]
MKTNFVTPSSFMVIALLTACSILEIFTTDGAQNLWDIFLIAFLYWGIFTIVRSLLDYCK